MAARAAIRDVGRVMDMSYTFCDGISKLVPRKPARPHLGLMPPDPKKEGDKYDYALEWSPSSAACAQSRRCAHLDRDGAKARRHDAQHSACTPGGVLIAPGKLTDLSARTRQPGSESWP